MQFEIMLALRDREAWGWREDDIVVIAGDLKSILFYYDSLFSKATVDDYSKYFYRGQIPQKWLSERSIAEHDASDNEFCIGPNMCKDYPFLSDLFHHILFSQSA